MDVDGHVGNPQQQADDTPGDGHEDRPTTATVRLVIRRHGLTFGRRTFRGKTGPHSYQARSARPVSRRREEEGPVSRSLPSPMAGSCRRPAREPASPKATRGPPSRRARPTRPCATEGPRVGEGGMFASCEGSSSGWPCSFPATQAAGGESSLRAWNAAAPGSAWISVAERRQPTMHRAT
jgi:hypothetical protein